MDWDRYTGNWEALGDEGIEKTLTEFMPREQVLALKSCLQPAPDRQRTTLTSNFTDIFNFDGAECVFLAVLGRDSDSIFTDDIHHLHIGPQEIRIEIGNSADAVSRIAIFQHVHVKELELSALWVNLRLNTQIKNLTIYTSWQQFSPGSALFERAMMENKNLKSLNVYPNSVQGMYPFTKSHDRFPGSNDDYGRAMSEDSLRRLMRHIEGGQSSLTSFGFMAFRSDISWLAFMVASPQTMLRGLTVTYASVPSGNDIEPLAQALRDNVNLESFEFHLIPNGQTKTASACARVVLSAFNQQDRQVKANQTVKQLVLSSVQSLAVEEVTSMLRTNRTLKRLGLQWCDLSPDDWIKVVKGLERNYDIRELDFSYSSGLEDPRVFEAVVGLLKSTETELKSMTVVGTGLQLQSSFINEQLRVNRYRANLAATKAEDSAEDVITPTAGRIVLMGFPHAGKTRLRKTMQLIETYDEGLEGFMHRHPHLSGLLGQGGQDDIGSFFSRKFDGMTTIQQLFLPGGHQNQSRTRGLEIKVIGKNPHTISIWDFAGQEEFHVLHDFVFPSARNSYFVYVCSAVHPPGSPRPGEDKDSSVIREEFRYWLRFIASNNALVVDRGRRHPSVAFVMTNVDTLTSRKRDECKRIASAAVGDLRVDFKEKLDIHETVEFIDARSKEDVKPLFKKLTDRLADILRASNEFPVCSDVREALRDRTDVSSGDSPVLSLEEVERLLESNTSLRRRLERLGSRELVDCNDRDRVFKEGLKTVLMYLNDVGEVIFAERLNYVFVDVPWFGREVLGNLIEPIAGHWRNAVPNESGFVRKSTLQEFLEDALEKRKERQRGSTAVLGRSRCEMLIELMIDLQFCLLEATRDEGPSTSRDVDPRYFFPALLADDGSDYSSGSKAFLQWSLPLNRDEQARVIYVGRRFQCEDDKCTFLTPGLFPKLQVVLYECFRDYNVELSQSLIRFAYDGMEVIVEYSRIEFYVDVLVKSTKEFDHTKQFIVDQVETKIVECCSSPQGCPGVHLVVGVIRPFCVKKLFSCEARKRHSVLVSTLKDKLTVNRAYSHSWKVLLTEEACSGYDNAADLLYGSGSGSGSQSSAASSSQVSPIGSRHVDSRALPSKLYFTTHDVKVISKLEAGANTAKRMPIMVHILCDGSLVKEPHTIERQPGRKFLLPVDQTAFSLDFFRFGLEVLWEGGKGAANFFNIRPPKSADEMMDKLLKNQDGEVDVKRLHNMFGSKGKKPEVRTEDILKYLKVYHQLCPDTEWLRKFLNIPAYDEFFRDFRLQRVANHSWVCDGCLTHFGEP